MLKNFTCMAGMAAAMLFAVSCSAPQPPRPEQLMLDDYDFMVNILNDLFPATSLVKEVYGIDAPKILFDSREKINAGMNELDFAEFIDGTLRACKGNHMWINPHLYGLEEKDQVQDLVRGLILPDAIKKTHQICEALDKRENLPPVSVELAYFDGAYYNKHDFTLNGTEYKYGMKLVSVDGRDPLEIVAGFQDKLDSFDYKRKLFYGNAFGKYTAHNFYRLMPPAPDNIRKFVFQPAAGGPVELAIGPGDTVVNQAPEQGFQCIGPTVTYLENDKILYIRIPAMKVADIPFYDKRIRNLLQGREIAAVVLDVRNNTGGSDLVWNRVLEFFVRELDTSFSLVTKDTLLASQFMGRVISLTAPNLVKKGVPVYSPFLDISEMQMYVLNICSKIKEGKEYPVYIISHDVYSSAGNLLSVGKALPNVTTVGLRNPVQLGLSTTAFFFSLPNSKLVISLTLQLDITRCKSAEDMMHTQLDLEVPLSAMEYLEYVNRDHVDDLPAYLAGHDPFYRAILEARKPKPEEKPPEVKPADKS